MIRAVLARLRQWTNRDEKSDRDEESIFAGSILDWSVEYSHGMGDNEAERELAAVQNQAQELENAQQHSRD